ncbi:50S ribosomal protein L20 [Natronogracilivirga saccharolytica]|uniref:Large ribosomal subunit protein bL20 n=1 Tax=Natronogracilivirga saccharolytica TaxID=2812953 RepID=A0A8J7UUK8_9BACT|nr:50S ribosomal protein L20 [Natronogracilivirga saccharolytica]MBP3193731.1 50S ribosomal protein L20 [Natronogracilivirga saccharolytica]
MPRSTNNVASRRRRKRILDRAKGYWGARSKVYTIAKNAVDKALQYQYRDRRVRKREFRKLWITRINAAARQNGTTYSKLMGAMKSREMEINRKVLADLAVHDPKAFSAVVETAQKKS